jgi:hypothetical protein
MANPSLLRCHWLFYIVACCWAIAIGQGVKERCRLSWLTNSDLVYAQLRGEGGCGVSASEYSCAHGAQINFGDLTPYLTYAIDHRK